MQNQLPGQNLNVTFNHESFKNQRKTTLKTTEGGSLDLGALIGISSLTVQGPSGKSRTWILRNDRRDQIENITLSENQQLKVPFVGSLNRSEVALYSLGPVDLLRMNSPVSNLSMVIWSRLFRRVIIA